MSGMSDQNHPTTATTPDAPAARRNARARRRFLRLFPFAVGGGIAATLLSTAFRFLRPSQVSPQLSGVTANAPTQWTEVAPLTELTGAEPLARQVSIRHEAGWSSRVEEQTVFVLPQDDHRVVSALCPHEGCEVFWRAEEKSFLCPCHDSRFDATGAPTSGPAQHDLFRFTTQVENGMLRIRYQTPAPGDHPDPAPFTG